MTFVGYGYYGKLSFHDWKSQGILTTENL